MNGDKTRRTVIAAAALVVAVAATILTWPAVVAFARTQGEPGPLAWLYPAMAGGLAVAAALLLVWDARTGRRGLLWAWIVFAAALAFTAWAVLAQAVTR